MFLITYTLIALIIFVSLLHEICKTYAKLTLGDLILSFTCGFLWPFFIIGLVFLLLIQFVNSIMLQSTVKAILNIEIARCKEDS